MVIRICVIRHSKSGSNLLRERGEGGQDLHDPGLTILGKKAAHEYSPKLIRLLEKNGFDLSSTVIGASPLRRAQETAHALFPDTTIHIFGELNEHGHIPENIPRCNTSTRKGWNRFLQMLSKTYSSDEKPLTVIAVGHRTFFRKEVLQPLGKDHPMNNMDAAILEIDCSQSQSRSKPKTRFIKHIPHGKTIRTAGDRYIDRYKRKTRRYSSMARRTQKGGGNFPYGYFHDGAQAMGRSDSATGAGLGTTSDLWAREPIQQSGGSRSTCKCQRGGFPASIMGSFVQNGMSLMPAAGYMLYRSQKDSRGNRNNRKTRNNRKSRNNRKATRRNQTRKSEKRESRV